MSNSDLDTSGSKLKRSDLLAGYMSNSNDYSSYSKLKSNDSGYYDGSSYKSKYDDLLSDVTSSSRHTPRNVAYTGSSTSRQLKPYKRTDSDTRHRTAINLYELLDNDEKQPQSSYRRQYSKGKSAGKGLSTTTNKYADMSSTDESSDDFSDIEKTERENRRKEIQSLIMKYAQLDDFYGKAKDDNNNNSNGSSSKLDPWDTKAQSPVVIPSKKQPSSSKPTIGLNPLGKSQTMASIAPQHYQSNYDYYGYDPSWYDDSYNKSRRKGGGHVVPITTYAPKSSSKSRMSKALSTFVRNMRREEKKIYFVMKIKVLHKSIFFCCCVSVCAYS